MERARAVIDVTVKKDSVLVYVLKFFLNFGGRCGSVVVRKRDWDSRSGFDPFFLFNRNTLNDRSKNFLSVLKMAATVYERDNCDGACVVCIDRSVCAHKMM